MVEEKIGNDIWVKGIKTICGHHKKALLDYIDALSNRSNNPESIKSLGQIKAKVHNDLSQVQLMISILFETFRAGGSIKPFEDSFSRMPQKENRNDKNSRPQTESSRSK